MSGTGRRLLSVGILTLAVQACGGDPCRAPAPPPLSAIDSVLLNPGSEAFRQRPPDTFYVQLATSEGPLTLEIIRDWAPLAAFRFYNLVQNGFYDGSRFFRVVPGFVAQFGTNGHPAVDAAWAEQKLPDDPVRVSNLEGTVAFAMSGPGTRVTQVFINYHDNPGLDARGFAPFGRVIRGNGVLLKLDSDYGEPAPLGSGPPWECVLRGGNTYLQKRYPRLDYIDSARVTVRP